MIKELVERVQSAFAAGQEDERMHVVQHLRRMSAETSVPAVALEWRIAADTIEKGEHRK
jgi:esterase/lipase superfamily enzyme